jgi:glycosyltransferase involved in cell wall biosynthesis
MSNKPLSISLVIPVYNEESHLADCLRSALAQRVPFAEIIVVDNNSTDDTKLIAQSFAGVTVLSEARQGVVHARNRGFDAVTSTLIARIDADTILPTDWTSRLQAIFASSDVAAVSGAVEYHDLPWQTRLARLDLHFRLRIADGMGDEVFLFGANMALRRSAWRATRTQMCSASGMHEDFDVAIHLQDAGYRVVFDRTLVAQVSLRRLSTSVATYWEYLMLSPRTYALHGRTSQRHMYSVIGLVMSSYWLIRLIYRCYDPEKDELSLRNLRAVKAPLRVNPATFVD